MAAVDCVLCGETPGISVGGGGSLLHTHTLSAQSNCLSLHRTPLCCHLPAHVRAHTPPAPPRVQPPPHPVHAVDVGGCRPSLHVTALSGSWACVGVARRWREGSRSVKQPGKTAAAVWATSELGCGALCRTPLVRARYTTYRIRRRWCECGSQPTCGTWRGLAGVGAAKGRLG